MAKQNDIVVNISVSKTIQQRQFEPLAVTVSMESVTNKDTHEGDVEALRNAVILEISKTYNEACDTFKDC